MKWPVLTCPFCRGRLPNEQLWPGKPLVCPTCSQELQLERRQLHLSGTIALALTVVACYVFGARGLWLLAASVVFWFPIFVVWEFISSHLMPTRFEKFGGSKEPRDYGHNLLGK